MEEQDRNNSRLGTGTVAAVAKTCSYYGVKPTHVLLKTWQQELKNYEPETVKQVLHRWIVSSQPHEMPSLGTIRAACAEITATAEMSAPEASRPVETTKELKPPAQGSTTGSDEQTNSTGRA